MQRTLIVLTALITLSGAAAAHEASGELPADWRVHRFALQLAEDGRLLLHTDGMPALVLAMPGGGSVAGSARGQPRTRPLGWLAWREYLDVVHALQLASTQALAPGTPWPAAAIELQVGPGVSWHAVRTAVSVAADRFTVTLSQPYQPFPLVLLRSASGATVRVRLFSAGPGVSFDPTIADLPSQGPAPIVVTVVPAGLEEDSSAVALEGWLARHGWLPDSATIRGFGETLTLPAGAGDDIDAQMLAFAQRHIRPDSEAADARWRLPAITVDATSGTSASIVIGLLAALQHQEAALSPGPALLPQQAERAVVMANRTTLRETQWPMGAELRAILAQPHDAPDPAARWPARSLVSAASRHRYQAGFVGGLVDRALSTAFDKASALPPSGLYRRRPDTLPAAGGDDLDIDLDGLFGSPEP